MATCGYEHSAYGPHDGCAEFTPEPDTWLCGSPAVVRASWLGTGDGITWEPMEEFACSEHRGSLEQGLTEDQGLYAKDVSIQELSTR